MSETNSSEIKPERQPSKEFRGWIQVTLNGMFIVILGGMGWFLNNLHEKTDRAIDLGLENRSNLAQALASYDWWDYPTFEKMSKAVGILLQNASVGTRFTKEQADKLEEELKGDMKNQYAITNDKIARVEELTLQNLRAIREGEIYSRETRERVIRLEGNN